MGLQSHLSPNGSWGWPPPSRPAFLSPLVRSNVSRALKSGAGVLHSLQVSVIQTAKDCFGEATAAANESYYRVAQNPARHGFVLCASVSMASPILRPGPTLRDK